MLKFLMNNGIVGFLFGIVVTALIHTILILTGETTNLAIFAAIFGMISSGAKEVVNAIVISKEFNAKVLFLGAFGSVLMAFIIMLLEGYVRA